MILYKGRFKLFKNLKALYYGIQTHNYFICILSINFKINYKNSKHIFLLSALFIIWLIYIKGNDIKYFIHIVSLCIVSNIFHTKVWTLWRKRAFSFSFFLSFIFYHFYIYLHVYTLFRPPPPPLSVPPTTSVRVKPIPPSSSLILLKT
jgi:hypothetical protein